MERKDLLILGIETSCDETSASVVRNNREVLSLEIYSQIKIHRQYGGVVPEIASRNHVDKLPYVVDAALKQAGLTCQDLTAIGVTKGPGLVGALLTGVAFAKGLALSCNKPLVPVNHMEGHICANYITSKDLQPPFICLVVSGGHTAIVKVVDYGVYELLGQTRDDAAGEAYDKVARVLGMEYPGGPNLEKLAKQGNPHAYPMPKSFRGEDHLDFSFSGIKTHVINLLHNLEQRNEPYRKADIAASFQEAVVAKLADNTIEAAKRQNLGQIALAGGVSANQALRDAIQKRAHKLGMKVYYPQMIYCTDNGAMIASAASFRYQKWQIAAMDLNADPSYQIF